MTGDMTVKLISPRSNTKLLLATAILALAIFTFSYYIAIKHLSNSYEQQRISGSIQSE